MSVKLASILRAVVTAFATLTILAMLGEAVPEGSFPINSQIPPIARIDQGFLFTFARETFSGSESNVSYSLVNSPSWLKLDKATRTFFGVPTKDDFGASKFELVATDGTGAGSMPVTFIVSKEEGPKPGLSEGSPLFNSLSRVFTLHQGSKVFLALEESIFLNTNNKTEFFAVSEDNSPLPSWLTFDSKSLSFSGTSPKLKSWTETQIYPLRVIASDIPGFSEAEIKLKFVVRAHDITFRPSLINISIIEEQPVTIDLKKNLQVSNNTNLTLFTTVRAHPPAWLKLNRTNLVLSGIPPRNVTSSWFDVSVADAYEDEANATVILTATKEKLLGSVVPQIYAPIKGNLSFTLPSEIFLVSGLNASVDIGTCSSWMRYEATNRTLFGAVPKKALPGNTTRCVTLIVDKGSNTASEQIPVTFACQDDLRADGSYEKPTHDYIFPPPWQCYVSPPPVDVKPSLLKIAIPAFSVLLVIVLVIGRWWQLKLKRERIAREAAEEAGRENESEAHDHWDNEAPTANIAILGQFFDRFIRGRASNTFEMTRIRRGARFRDTAEWTEGLGQAGSSTTVNMGGYLAMTLPSETHQRPVRATIVDGLEAIEEQPQFDENGNRRPATIRALRARAQRACERRRLRREAEEREADAILAHRIATEHLPNSQPRVRATPDQHPMNRYPLFFPADTSGNIEDDVMSLLPFAGRHHPTTTESYSQSSFTEPQESNSNTPVDTYLPVQAREIISTARASATQQPVSLYPITPTDTISPISLTGLSSQQQTVAGHQVAESEWESIEIDSVILNHNSSEQHNGDTTSPSIPDPNNPDRRKIFSKLRPLKDFFSRRRPERDSGSTMFSMEYTQRRLARESNSRGHQ